MLSRFVGRAAARKLRSRDTGEAALALPDSQENTEKCRGGFGQTHSVGRIQISAVVQLPPAIGSHRLGPSQTGVIQMCAL